MMHTYQTIIFPSIIAFLFTLIAIKFVFYYMPEIGIVGIDNNKKEPKVLPSSGGIAVAFGITMGLLTYIFGSSYVFKAVIDRNILLAISLSIVLIAFVGFLDDLNVKERKVKTTDMLDIRKGLPQWIKPILTIVGAIPLIAISAGNSTVHIPFIGAVSLGLFYNLIILPLAIIFSSNVINLLGGYDGLQAGMSAVAAAGFFLYSFLTNNYLGLFLSSIVLFSLIAFLLFNWYPAKLIPGDSLPYSIGAAFIAIMIVSNEESFGLIVFIPWFIEFFLHLRRKFKVTDIGKLRNDLTFEPPYGKKIYSLTHLIMNLKRVKEKEITIYLMIFEGVFVLLGLIMFYLKLL